MNRSFLSIVTFTCFFVLISGIQSCDPQDNTNTEHCTNGVKDEDETAVDCGGALCDTCLTAPVACFTGPDSVLVLGPAEFNDCSTGATSYTWNFGDGQTSALASPSHSFSVTGTYTVKQVVSNGQTTDSTTKSIEVKEVKNYHYAGNYLVHTVCPGSTEYTVNGTIAPSGTDNISINFNGTLFCTAVVNGYNITIPTQTVGTQTVSGNGTLSYNRLTVTLNYSQEVAGFPTESCSSTLQWQ